MLESKPRSLKDRLPLVDEDWTAYGFDRPVRTYWGGKGDGRDRWRGPGHDDGTCGLLDGVGRRIALGTQVLR